MFDIEALDTGNLFPLNKAEKQNFISLFNWVPVKGENTFGRSHRQDSTSLERPGDPNQRRGNLFDQCLSPIRNWKMFDFGA